MCINDQRYVCYCECYVVSNELFFCFRGELGFLHCDDICMCDVNKHFELLEFVFVSVVVVIDLPFLRVAVEGSDNPVSLEKPCQTSLPPDQQGRHSLGRHPEVQYVA